MKSAFAGDTGKLTVRLGATGAYAYASVSRTLSATAWKRVSGNITLDWQTGAPPAGSAVYAETATGAADLEFDDVRLRKVTEPTQTTFDAWRAFHFTDAQRLDPAQSDAAASPAGDGLSNLFKFALGLTPTTTVPAASISHLAAYGTAGQYSLQFRRQVGAPLVTIKLESSPNLSDWTTLTTTPAIEPDAVAGLEWLRYTVPAPADTIPATFYRLRLTSP